MIGLLPAMVLAALAAALPDVPCDRAPLRREEVRYYCDCQAGAAAGCKPGDDRNAGKTPARPRRTLGGAVERFNDMPAGGTVAFCRGGSFAVDARANLHNPRCTAAAPCDFRDYTPAGMDAAPRPVFLAGAKSFLALVGGGIRKEGHRLWNLDVRHTAGQGVTLDIGDSSSDVDICNVAGSGGSIGVLEQTTNQRVTIRDSQWSEYADHGILAGSNGLRIDSNTFVDAGAGNGNRTHVIYLQGGIEQPPDGYHDERVVNNDIRLRSCTGPVIVANGRNHDMVIENNRITVEGGTGACYGMGIGHGGYPYACWHHRAVIRGNRITIPVSAVGIAVSVCADCTISDNAIALTSPTNGYFGINLVENAARTAELPGEVPTTRATVQNNSIYLAYDADDSTGTAIRIGKEGADHVVENNAAWTRGPSCFALAAPTRRVAGNYCQGKGGPDHRKIFVDAPRGDLRPAPGGPLVGAGSTVSYSPRALSPSWSARAPGVPRAPPIDVGAFLH